MLTPERMLIHLFFSSFLKKKREFLEFLFTKTSDIRNHMKAQLILPMQPQALAWDMHADYSSPQV